QTVVVTYIGYLPLNVDVNIPLGGTIRRDFGLEPEVLQGREVIVTAQALGQMQAINQQLASDKISSIVSEARIQELPDFNAAQALSRLPGVSTLESSGEANKVVIRGLAPQYNAVSVEGVKLSSTGSTQMGVSALSNTSGSISNDRSVDLSMISPYMIKSISVFKSLTPDMNANSIGGSVNMELREAPSQLHYDLMWQSGYTAKTGNFGNYRAVGSISQRFFNDNLGAYILVNAEKYDRDADNMNSVYDITEKRPDTTGFRPVIVNNTTLNRHVETRQRYGGNLIIDYKLPNGSIKSVNMLTRLVSDFTDINTVLHYADGLIYFNYRNGVNTTDLIVNSISFDYDFRWVKMDLKYARTSSKNNLPESPYLQFKSPGTAVSTNIPPNTKPEDLLDSNVVNTKVVNYPIYDQIQLDNINLFSSLYKESKDQLTLDFKVPYSFGRNLLGYIKIGGQYYNQDNSNDQKTPYAQLRSGNDFTDALIDDLEREFGIEYDPNFKFTGSNFIGDSHYTRSFLKNEFGQIWYACDPNMPTAMANYLASSPQWTGQSFGQLSGGWFNGPFQRLANTYYYEEKYYAGYVMSELTYRNIMVVGGARYEKMESKYTAYNMYDQREPTSQQIDTVTTRPTNEFILPMVQTKYSPSKWMDIRYAYTQTLARPDYHQLSPKVTYNNPRTSINAGNPDLVPAQAYNHDFNLTFHGNKIGLFSVGLFYKEVKNFTYSSSYKMYDSTFYDGLKSRHDEDLNILSYKPDLGGTLHTYVNSLFPAYVKGLEFDLQTRLWYLPKGLDGIILGINYTMIESEATYPIYDDTTVYPPRPLPRISYVTYTTRKGRLIYQPNDVVNAYIGYEIKGFSARISFLFQGNSVSRIGAFPEQDGYTKDYFRLDASVRQKLPFFGSEIYLDIININNEINSSAQTTIDGFTNIKNYGTTANLGIRLRL
ncbi:MAG: outer membrane beta-barrel protein, partial [Candidatus Marinimicrobia bacterium]|nr:outer membrane beta-barrel protein [Candidatus Neomarinimicrobiota bacterium]